MVAPAETEMDMGWLSDIEPAKPDGRLVVLRKALEEFRSAPPNDFLKVVAVAGRRYLVIGTWAGSRNGQKAYINGAPGKARSLLAATDLVEVDLCDDSPNGGDQHRVWLLPYAVKMPIKTWAHMGGRDAGRHHYLLTEVGLRKIDETQYAAARSAWS